MAHKLKKYGPIAAVIFLGAALKIALVFRPINFLVTNFISDDAFYYFLIAKNVLHGLGATVDGVNLANGFHPLWLIILLPIFKIFGTASVPDLAPIYATLGFSIILDAFIAIIIFRIVSRYTMNIWLRLTAMGLWLFNPFNIYEMLGGLETALSVLFVGFLILIGIKIRESRKNYLYILSGIVGGLMMLARLDNVFYFIFFLLWIFLTRGDKKYRKVLLVGIIATLVVLPWLVWNITTFGMIIPVSGTVPILINHTLVSADNGPGIFVQLKAVGFFTYLGLKQIIQYTGMLVLAFIFIGLFLGWWFLKRDSKLNFKLEQWPAELFLFFGFIANFVTNASIRWTFRSWYFVAFNIFFILFLSWLLDRITPHIKYKKIFAAVLLVVILGSFYVGWSQNLRNREIAQAEMLAAAEWGNENLPAGTIVGVFNSGVQGYFSKHRVTNIDGLVNVNAARAMEERRLWEYIKEENIEYISDFDIYPTYRYKAFLGIDDFFDQVEPVHTIALQSHRRSQDGIHIYKINK